MSDLIQSIVPFLHKVEDSARIYIALSGGMDSVALLHVVASKLGMDLSRMTALHVDHNLQSDSKVWAKFCSDYCEGLGVRCLVHRVKTQPRSGQSVEDWARQVRYDFFKSKLKQGDVLLSAHHQDDQAETLLLHLMRGTGVLGMQAMSPKIELGQGHLVRPWLGVARSQIEAYAKAEALGWVEDPSNQDQRFDRNFMRHSVMPLLKRRWPKAERSLARACDNLQAESMLTHALPLPLLQAHLGSNEMAAELSVSWLQSFERPVVYILLKTWLNKLGHRSLTKAHFKTIYDEVVHAGQGANPMFKYGTMELRRYRDRLYVMSALESADPDFRVKWDGVSPLRVPGYARLLTQNLLESQGLDIQALDWSSVEVTLRTSDMRCRPRGRGHSQTIKKLMQAYAIPPWLRSRLPVILCDQKVVMVLDAWVCD